MNTKYKRTDFYKKSYEKTITEGGFRDLEIGQSKKVAIEKLKKFGVHQLRYDVDMIWVETPDELDKLRSFDNLKVARGSVVIQFKNDQIHSLDVAYIYKDWEKRLRKAKTKDQVFEVLLYILSTAKKHDRSVVSYDPESGWIKLQEVTLEEVDLPERFNQWRGGFEGSEGSWHLNCSFANGILKQIKVFYSPAPL